MQPRKHPTCIRKNQRVKLIAPKTYIDPAKRYWARPRIKGRRTWRLLVDAKGKAITSLNKACAVALRDDWQPASDNFAALAQLYLDARCPTRKQKFKQPSKEFIKAETRQTAKLVEYFRTRPVSEVNDLLQIEPYQKWRLRQFEKGQGGRAVDKEIQTLSNIINYAVFGTKQERINFIMSNRPRYHVIKSRARDRMPANAAEIHQLGDYFLAGGQDGRSLRSEVFAWMTVFQMFTGCRTSELRRLRLDAKPNEAGHIANGYLHLGRRSKSGVNPYCAIGPEFAQMLECFKLWHRARFPKFQPYFCGPFGTVVGGESHCHALTKACRKLNLPHYTPHGLRAYFATKSLREGRTHAEVAAMLGDKTAALVGSTYADAPGENGPLYFVPNQGLPCWLTWQPEAAKIAMIA